MNNGIARISYSIFWRFVVILSLTMIALALMTGSLGMTDSSLFIFFIYFAIYLSIHFSLYWMIKRQGLVLTFVERGSEK